MGTTADIFGLLIVGLIIVALAKHPTIIQSFFSGAEGVLGLLTAA